LAALPPTLRQGRGSDGGGAVRSAGVLRFPGTWSAGDRGDFASALAADDLEALGRLGVVRTFARGQALLHQEQIPRHVLLLRVGRVKVSATTAAGSESVLAFRGPGDLVGELSALDEQPRSASVVAVESVEALLVDHGQFRGFLAERPGAAMALLGVLARRLRDADAKRIQFAAYTTTSRVADRLLELCERFGSQEGEVIRIALQLSQEELAGWTGSSIEAVGRALRTMRTLGWIETRRREIRVRDLDALRRLTT
jgi:CRP/FNR family transcriptional regulator, cyclic AMP receptor protein